MELPPTFLQNVENMSDEDYLQGGDDEDEYPRNLWECKKMIRKYRCQTTLLNTNTEARTCDMTRLRNLRDARNCSGAFELLQNGQKPLRSCLRQCPPGEADGLIGREAFPSFNQQRPQVVSFPQWLPQLSNTGGQGQQFYPSEFCPVTRLVNDQNQGALLQRQYFQIDPQSIQEIPANVFDYSDLIVPQNNQFLQHGPNRMYPLREVNPCGPVHPKPTDFLQLTQQQCHAKCKQQRRSIPQKYDRPEPQIQEGFSFQPPNTFHTNEPLQFQQQAYAREQENDIVPNTDLFNRYFQEGNAQTQKPRYLNAVAQTLNQDKGRSIQTNTAPGQEGAFQTADPPYSSEFVQTQKLPKDLKLTQTETEEAFSTTQTKNAYDNPQNTFAQTPRKGRRNSFDGEAGKNVNIPDDPQQVDILESALALQQMPSARNSTGTLSTRSKQKPNDHVHFQTRNSAQKDPQSRPDDPNRISTFQNPDSEKMVMQQNLATRIPALQNPDEILTNQNVANRMSELQIPDSNGSLAQQNVVNRMPELHELDQNGSLKEQNAANRMQALQTQDQKRMSAEQNVANRMQALQNQDQKRMSAEQNVANRMQALQNQDQKRMSAEQNVANRMQALQNPDSNMIAQGYNNPSPYSQNISKSQSAPGMFEEQNGDILPVPQIQERNWSPLRAVGPTSLNASNAGFGSRVLKRPYQPSQPAVRPSIIINLASTPCGSKCSCEPCRPCCDSIHIWEQIPKPVYPHHQIMVMPSFPDFPDGVPYNNNGAQRVRNRPNASAQFHRNSSGYPETTVDENYAGKSTIEQNNLISLEEDLLETSRKNRSEASSSNMTFSVNEHVQRENRAAKNTEFYRANADQIPLVSQNGYPGPGLNYPTVYPFHPYGQQFPQMHSNFLPNPYTTAELNGNFIPGHGNRNVPPYYQTGNPFGSFDNVQEMPGGNYFGDRNALENGNGNYYNMPNQYYYPNTNTCAYEENQQSYNRLLENTGEGTCTKVRKPPGYPLKFENDRFKFDGSSEDEAMCQNQRLRQKCERKWKRRICNCKGLGPPRKSMNCNLMED